MLLDLHTWDKDLCQWAKIHQQALEDFHQHEQSDQNLASQVYSILLFENLKSLIWFNLTGQGISKVRPASTGRCAKVLQQLQK